jgi:hypothetical protein
MKGNIEQDEYVAVVDGSCWTVRGPIVLTAIGPRAFVIRTKFRTQTEAESAAKVLNSDR